MRDGGNNEQDRAGSVRGDHPSCKQAEAEHVAQKLREKAGGKGLHGGAERREEWSMQDYTHGSETNTEASPQSRALLDKQGGLVRNEECFSHHCHGTHCPARQNNQHTDEGGKPTKIRAYSCSARASQSQNHSQERRTLESSVTAYGEFGFDAHVWSCS